MADERTNFRVNGYVYSAVSSQVQPGYGPYNGSDGATNEAAAFEKAFGPTGIGKETDGIQSPIGLKFMIRYLDSNSQLHCDEYIYLGGTIETDKSITNPRYIKLNRQLKSETALNKAAGDVNTTSSKVYPIVTDSGGNLAVVVPWTDTTYVAATTSAAGLMSASDKEKVDQLVPVFNAGGWNVDQNFQPGGISNSSDTAVIPEGLETRLSRIEAVLSGLYGNEEDGSEDAEFIIEDDGTSNN